MANNNTVKKKKVKMSTGDKAFAVINTIIMILVCIAIVYPLYYVLLASVTDPVVVSSGKFLLYPEAWYTNGYATTEISAALDRLCKHHQVYRSRNADFPGMHHSGRICTFQIRYGRKKANHVPVHLHDVLQRRYDSDVLNGTAAAHLQHNMGYGSSGSSIRLQPDRMPLLL